MTREKKTTAKPSRRSRKAAGVNLTPQLAQLENAQLVRRLGEEEATYAFKHTLTQEMAYESLLLRTRREIHRSVAEAYERIYADRCLDEFASILAQHYAEAGDDAKTLDYATRAGDVAARVYANAEEIALYTQALDAAKRVGTRHVASGQLQHLFTQRGRAYELAAEYPRAIENYQEMQALARVRSDRPLELESLMLQTTAYAVALGRRDWQKAQAFSSEALALARQLDDRKAEARIYWNLLLINRFGNEGPQKAVEYGEKSLALARELNLKEQIALTLKDLAPAYLIIGKISSARKNLPETLALWRELDNKPMLAEVLGGASSGYLAAGELQQAVQAGQEAVALNQSIGNRYGLAVTTTFLWYVYREMGEMGRAIDLAEQSLALADELGFLGPDWGACVELADTFVEFGAFARAEEYVKRALATADAVPNWRPRSYPSAVLARLHLRQGNRDRAEQVLAPFLLHTADSELAPSSSLFAPLTILSAHAELAMAQGDAARANTIADDLVTSFNRLEVVCLGPSALHLKAQALSMLNRVDEAYGLMGEARRQAEAMHLRYRLLPILLTLLEMETERGEAAQAERVRQQAREIVEHIAAHTPAEVRASFLNLPKVQAVRQ